MAVMQRAINRQERLIQEYDQLGGHAFDGHGARASPDARPDATRRSSVRTRSSRAASASWSRWRPASRRSPTCCSSTSPRPISTPYAAAALEELVREFPGAVVMVSHDRYLLDETVTRDRRARPRRVRMWPGNYSAYHAARELELQQQQAAWHAQQKEIARLEDAIRRYKQWASMVDDPSPHDPRPQHPAADRPHGQGRAAGARAAQDRPAAAERRARRQAGRRAARRLGRRSTRTPC